MQTIPTSHARLDRQFLASENLTVPHGPAGTMPERIVQFGEGNFLRGFADWMVDRLNREGLFHGNIAIVQPVKQGLAEIVNDQDGIHTLILRGIEGGGLVETREIITAASRALNPYEDWDGVVRLARSPELRFVFSNTTEAGIAYVEETYDGRTCPSSFPAKVTALLHERFLAVHGDPAKGLVFLPCELIESNGAKLREYVLKHAEAWRLGAGFVNWVETANHFLNTLVDRIVPGYPGEESARLKSELGYEDRLMVAAEVFHLWVIEGPGHLAEEIPFHKAGLNVVWTDDMTPFRTRKVRVLNGAHTSSVLGAFLAGLDTVGAMMDDEVFGRFLRQAVFGEIVPALRMDDAERRGYANAVLERFRNPFIKHELLSISLNSVSKWKVRVLPSLLDSLAENGALPPALVFSLAALIGFYDGVPVSDTELRGTRDGAAYPIRDDAPVLRFFAEQWRLFHASGDLPALVGAVLANPGLWGRDLMRIDGLADVVTADLQAILTNGARAAAQSILK